MTKYELLTTYAYISLVLEKQGVQREAEALQLTSTTKETQLNGWKNDLRRAFKENDSLKHVAEVIEKTEDMPNDIKDLVGRTKWPLLQAKEMKKLQEAYDLVVRRHRTRVAIANAKEVEKKLGEEVASCGKNLLKLKKKARELNQDKKRYEKPTKKVSSRRENSSELKKDAQEKRANFVEIKKNDEKIALIMKKLREATAQQKVVALQIRNLKQEKEFPKQLQRNALNKVWKR